MRKVMFAAVVSAIALALVPASALAHGDHHRGRHRAHRSHTRVRHEHFGSRIDATQGKGNGANDAGTVASFTGGVLTLKLNDGSMVSGMVTSATEIKCEVADGQEMEHSRHADGDRKDSNDRGEDEPAGPMCSTANLAPGAVVSDAELTILGTGAVWTEVELGQDTADRGDGPNHH